MKKIVGILSAAAVLAASVFAADVSATAKLESDLFSFNTNTKTVKLFDAINMSDADTLKFAVTTDNAGAKFILKQANKGTISGMGIWFKPIDSIKLSFQENGLGLQADKIHYWDYYKKANVGAGYGIEYTADALSVALNICPTFLTSGNDTVTVGQFGLKVGYNADFGNIIGLVKFDKNFESIDIGASYQKNISGVDLVADASVYLNKGFSGVSGLVYAGYTLDALSISAVSNVFYRTDEKKEADKVEGNTEVAVVVNVGYRLDALNIKAFFDCDNLLFKTFSRNWANDDKAAMKVGVSLSSSVGIASWEVTPQYDFYKEVASVAFNTSVSF